MKIKNNETAILIILSVVIVFVAFTSSALIAMLLWNNFLSPVAHLAVIDFWQSLALVFTLSFIGGFFKK